MRNVLFYELKIPAKEKKKVEENHILLEIMFILEGENNIYKKWNLFWWQ